MKVKVKCIVEYNDTQKNRNVKPNEEFIVDKARADQLVNAKVCEVIETIKEEKENKKKPEKKKENAKR